MQTEICVLKNLQATQIAHTHVSQEENYVLSATFLYDGIGVSDQGLPPEYWSSSPAKVAYSRLKLAFFQQPTSICARKRHDKQHVNHIQQLILRIFCSHQDCPWQAKFADATRSCMQHKDTVEGDGPATKTGCRTLSLLLSSPQALAQKSFPFC